MTILSSTATVATTLPDYAPGSYATIDAAGFDPGAFVEFTVQIYDPLTGALIDPVFWTATVGADGTITTNFAVTSLYAGQTMLLTATEGTFDSAGAFVAGGPVATTRFSDFTPEPDPIEFPSLQTNIDLAAVDGSGNEILNTVSAAGATFANFGTPLDPASRTGTGVFNTFEQVQNKGAEQGFNTTDNTVLDGKNSDQHNTSILLSNLQAVYADGTVVSGTPTGDSTYYEFKLDIHQENPSPYLSLDGLQIWQSTTANLGTGTFTSGADTQGAAPSFSFNPGEATSVYDMGNTSVLLNSSFTAGSGGGSKTGPDLVVLVPTTDFNTSYGDNVYLYSAFGFQGGDWSANSTFEEWGARTNVAAAPAINVEKLVSVDGGANWYFQADDSGDSVDTIAAETGISASDLHIGMPTLIVPGSYVPEFRVVVTNTGNVADTNISVSDVPTPSGPFTFGNTDAATIASLDTGASALSNILYGTAPATGGAFFSDTATVTADGGLSDSDTASYFTAGSQPQGSQWSLYKDVTVSAPFDTNDPEAAAPSESNPLFATPTPTVIDQAGQTLAYTVTLVNTGATAIAASDITATDAFDNGAATPLGAPTSSSNSDTSALDAGASWTWTYTETVTQPMLNAGGVIANTASVSDTTDGLLPETATTSVGVDQDPGIDIEKLVSVDGGRTWNVSLDNGDTTAAISAAILAATSASQTVVAGSPTVLSSATPPEYEFLVTNTGNVDLSNVVVSDDPALAGLPITISSLGAGVSALKGAFDGTWTAGPNPDTATASTTFNGSPVSASDSANYFGATTGLTIDKQISVDGGHTWLDVGPNMFDPTLLSSGAEPEYQFIVTNTGNVDLANVAVTDSLYGSIGTIASLAAGASTALSATEAWAAGQQTDKATASASYTDSAGNPSTPSASDSANYFGAAPGVTIDKQVAVHQANSANDVWLDVGNGVIQSLPPGVLQGELLDYRVLVTNTSTGNLSETVSVTDASTTAALNALSFTFGAPATTSVTLAAGASATSNIVTAAAVAGSQSDTATATGTVHDSAGNIGTATASDSVSFSGSALTTAGLTKGYWANHSWTGIEPSQSGNSLILGDVNVSGTSNDSGCKTLFQNGVNEILPAFSVNDSLYNLLESNHYNDLTIGNTAAQALANSATSTDARVILASQLVAAQLNDYNEAKFDGAALNPLINEAAPNGLIEDAVLWLTGNDFGSGVSSTLDLNANVDQNHNGILDLATDYTIAKNGSITFAKPALSSSSAAFQTFQQVLSSWTGGDKGAISANGNGLANALTAYNQDQLVVSKDGSLIGWNNGSSVIDVQTNSAGAFWGILADQHIAGVQQA